MNWLSRMVSSDINPLVAITIVPKFRPSYLSLKVSRSMGVVVSRLRGNHRLVLTCRHAFHNLDDQHECFLGIRKNCRLEMLGPPIFDTNQESDIAFLVVRDEMNILTEPMVLTPDDYVVGERSVLYNAQNVSNGVYNPSVFNVMRQFPVRERIEEAIFVKYSDPFVWQTPVDNTSLIQKLNTTGWQRCRSFTMRSRPGFSGSPVWNDNLQFIGMDIRGSNRDDRNGDVMVCIPSSQIFMSYNKLKSQIESLVNNS